VNGLKAIVVLLGIFVLAQLTAWPYLDELTFVLVGFVLVAYVWSRLAVAGLTVERYVSGDRFQVGQDIHEEITVTSASFLPKLWLEVVDGSTLPRHRAGRVFNMARHGEVSWMTDSSAVRRGRFRLGPTVIRAGDPFGLFPRERRFDASREVVVYPAVAESQGYSPPAGLLSGGAVSASRGSTTTSNVAGIREYVVGDPQNRISWSASARRGTLMVKELEFDPSSDVWIVLDLDRSTHIAAVYSDDWPDWPDWRAPPVPWLDSTEEYAVSAAASLSSWLLASGRSVGLVCTNDVRAVIHPERGQHQQLRILETLAVVQADGSKRLAESIIEEARRFTGPSAIVVVTASTDPDWVGVLAEVAGRSARAGAVLIEPDSFGPAPAVERVTDALGGVAIRSHLVACGDLIGDALAGPGVDGIGRTAISRTGRLMAVKGRPDGQ